MLYKTIVLELLEQNPALYEQLRKDRAMLSSLEVYASELKANHEAWKERLNQARPGSDSNQIASEALEIALQELEECLRSESPPDATGPLSLDGAMAYIRRHTPPA
jgi:hypothetical protein